QCAVLPGVFEHVAAIRTNGGFQSESFRGLNESSRLVTSGCSQQKQALELGITHLAVCLAMKSLRHNSKIPSMSAPWNSDQSFRTVQGDQLVPYRLGSAVPRLCQIRDSGARRAQLLLTNFPAAKSSLAVCQVPNALKDAPPCIPVLESACDESLNAVAKLV